MDRRLLRTETLGPGDAVSVRLAWNLDVPGTLFLPLNTERLIILAHGSGLCGPDNVHLARVLHRYNIGTLLFDLLSPEEAQFDEKTGQLRTDTVMLGDRLVGATIWVEENRDLRLLELGILGDDAGAAAAMITAARLPQMVKALVLRSGNVEAARSSWPFVQAATLLLTGNKDPYQEANHEAQGTLPGKKALQVIKECADLLQDCACLDFVGEFAAEWFVANMKGQKPARTA
jgi:putative phosphoribosyl transferase